MGREVVGAGAIHPEASGWRGVPAVERCLLRGMTRWARDSVRRALIASMATTKSANFAAKSAAADVSMPTIVSIDFPLAVRRLGSERH